MIDHRVRPAIRNPGVVCAEMHCEALAENHRYGEKGCSWVQLEDRSVISREEARETTTRPDRIN